MRLLFWATLLSFYWTNACCQATDAALKITPLTGNFYIYTTYSLYQGSPIPAHGMYLVTNKGVALFDTPWDTSQFKPLLDSIEKRHHQKVVWCIATHWHSDRTEGLEYYQQQGIKTYTSTLTDAWSKKNNKKRAQYLFARDTLFTMGEYSFETFYPGPGHTEDNIVLWFDKEKILYGGCLIKGAEAKDLGFLGDGNKSEYEATLKKVQKKYHQPKFIIVSHHNWNNNKALVHSIKLAKKLKSKK